MECKGGAIGRSDFSSYGGIIFFGEIQHLASYAHTPKLGSDDFGDVGEMGASTQQQISRAFVSAPRNVDVEVRRPPEEEPKLLNSTDVTGFVCHLMPDFVSQASYKHEVRERLCWTDINLRGRRLGGLHG